MQEMRLILDLDMLHKNYKEVWTYINELPKTFPGLVKYMSSSPYREPDKDDEKESSKDIKEDKVRTPIEEI